MSPYHITLAERAERQNHHSGHSDGGLRSPNCGCGDTYVRHSDAGTSRPPLLLSVRLTCLATTAEREIDEFGDRFRHWRPHRPALRVVAPCGLHIGCWGNVFQVLP